MEKDLVLEKIAKAKKQLNWPHFIIGDDLDELADFYIIGNDLYIADGPSVPRKLPYKLKDIDSIRYMIGNKISGNYDDPEGCIWISFGEEYISFDIENYHTDWCLYMTIDGEEYHGKTLSRVESERCD